MTIDRKIYLLIISLLVFGCSPELDETKTTTVLEDPEVIDAFFISSTVYHDFSNLPVADIEVEFISETYKAETNTNTDGEFYFEIPPEVTEGIVYIYKEAHFPILLKYDQVTEIEEVVFLSEDITNTTGPITSFDDLFTIEGRVVYPDGSPVTDAIMRVSSPSSENAPGFRILSLGIFHLGPDGRYSIVADSLSASPTIEISGQSLEDRCQSGFGTTIEVNRDYIQLDDIVYDRIYEESVEINISATECLPGLKSKVYLGYQVPLGLFDEDLGDVTVPYCDNFSTENVYVGVEDAEGQSFDGVFLSELEDGMSFEFEPCVPVVKFFDMIYQGNLRSYQVTKYDTITETFIFEDPDITISYDYNPTFSNCNTSTCGEKEFHFTYMTKFEFKNNDDPSENFIYNDDIFMDNVVNNDSELAGIIMSLDGELKIRFRVEKI